VRRVGIVPVLAGIYLSISRTPRALPRIRYFTASPAWQASVSRNLDDSVTSSSLAVYIRVLLAPLLLNILPRLRACPSRDFIAADRCTISIGVSNSCYGIQVLFLKFAAGRFVREHDPPFIINGIPYPLYLWGPSMHTLLRSSTS